MSILREKNKVRHSFITGGSTESVIRSEQYVTYLSIYLLLSFLSIYIIKSAVDLSAICFVHQTVPRVIDTSHIRSNLFQGTFQRAKTFVRR